MGFADFLPVIGDVVNFGLNQFSKSQDRKFTQQMYERQLADSRENWRMMNEYNSPSAQMERLLDAGLNPNLIYGSGGVTGTTSLPQNTSFSGGYSKASEFSSSNPLQYMQLRSFQKDLQLKDAQIEKIQAETKNVASNTDLNEWQLGFNKATEQVKQDLLFGNLRQINSSIQKMDNEVFNANRLTDSQLDTMAQAREYQIKQFGLTEFEVGERIKQGWENVATGKIQASAAMKNACAAALNASTNANLSEWQIGKMAVDILNGYKTGRTIDLRNYGQEIKNYVDGYDANLKNFGIGTGSSIWDNAIAPIISIPLNIMYGTARSVPAWR